MSYLKITVTSGTRSETAYVPTRNQDDVPLTRPLIDRLVRNVASSLAHLALGELDADILEMGDPWKPKDEPLYGVNDMCHCGHRRSSHWKGEEECQASECQCGIFTPIDPNAPDYIPF
jgi:hypothetical protein